MSITVEMINLPVNGNFVASSLEERIFNSYRLDKYGSPHKSFEKKVIGKLRWEFVSNGNYGRYNPIWDKNESIVGYLVGGFNDIGYTYCCLYSDSSNRFFVSHVPYAGAENSFISTVEVIGKLRLFKQGLKFKRTSSLSFPYEWVGSELIYRFINDGKSLLCVSRLGFCVINIYQSSLLFKTLFGNDYTHMVTGAALSPNTRLLAITMSEYRYTDPVAGKEIYQNTIRIYDVKSGEQIGIQDLEVASRMIDKCNIRFSEDGSVVSISYGDFNKLFKLVTISS